MTKRPAVNMEVMARPLSDFVNDGIRAARQRQYDKLVNVSKWSPERAAAEADACMWTWAKRERMLAAL